MLRLVDFLIHVVCFCSIVTVTTKNAVVAREQIMYRRSIPFELCELVLSEIPPRTLPAFIPSDHVHPLFISLTHFPRCRDMIPMSSPTLNSDDPPLPHPLPPLYLSLLWCLPLLQREGSQRKSACTDMFKCCWLVKQVQLESYGAIHLSSLLMQPHVFGMTGCLLPSLHSLLVSACKIMFLLSSGMRTECQAVKTMSYMIHQSWMRCFQLNITENSVMAQDEHKEILCKIPLLLFTLRTEKPSFWGRHGFRVHQVSQCRLWISGPSPKIK